MSANGIASGNDSMIVIGCSHDPNCAARMRYMKMKLIPIASEKARSGFADRAYRNYIMRRIYLDSNATTPMRPEVVAAMMPVFTENFGNASSIHWYGQTAKALIDDARLGDYRINAATLHGVVTLQGNVPSKADVDHAIAVARKVRGVKDVKSELKVAGFQPPAAGHQRPATSFRF